MGGMAYDHQGHVSHDAGKPSALPRNFDELVQRCKQNKQTCAQVGGVLSVVFVIYMFFSDGDFSFLMTLSSILSFASFCNVAWVIFTKGSVAGVSCRMMECYVVAFFTRLISILTMDGYLPYDRTGDYIYRATEIGCFFASVGIVYLCRVHFAHTYNEHNDTFKSYFLIGPSLVLGVLFHPHLNGYMLCDVAWSMALYLESIACLPQLVLFRKEKKVEEFTTNFLLSQIMVRLLSFIFWASSSRDLHSYHLEGTLREYASWMVILMQCLQLVVMGDFLYQFIQCWRKGVPLQFILNDVV